MKVSYNWLKQYINCELSAEEIAKKLTGTGLEVEDLTPYESIKGALKGVTGKFYEDPFFDCDVHDEAYMKAVDEFDKSFPYMEKKVLPHQWR